MVRDGIRKGQGAQVTVKWMNDAIINQPRKVWRGQSRIPHGPTYRPSGWTEQSNCAAQMKDSTVIQENRSQIRAVILRGRAGGGSDSALHPTPYHWARSGDIFCCQGCLGRQGDERHPMGVSQRYSTSYLTQGSPHHKELSCPKCQQW